MNEEVSTNYCVGVCPNCCVITLALLGCWSRSPNARCLWLSAAGGNSFIARLLTSMGTCSVPVGSQYRTRYFILCTLRIKFNIFKMISKQEDRRHVKSFASKFNKIIFHFYIMFHFLFCAQISIKST